METPDYYEFLQISPNAETDTIQRVYRFLAVRLHPDNPETGDAEKFFLLKQAYDVLSDPVRRAEYDAAWKHETPQKAPLSTTIDFMDNMEGELNGGLQSWRSFISSAARIPTNRRFPFSKWKDAWGFPAITWNSPRGIYETRDISRARTVLTSP